MGIDDPVHPRNLSITRKRYLIVVEGMSVLNAAFASSATARAIRPIMEGFGLSRATGILR